MKPRHFWWLVSSESANKPKRQKMTDDEIAREVEWLKNG